MWDWTHGLSGNQAMALFYLLPQVVFILVLLLIPQSDDHPPG